MQSTRTWTFIKLLIFYCLLSSAKASCTLGQNIYIDSILSILCWIYFFHNKLFSPTKNGVIAVFFLCLGAILCAFTTSTFHTYPLKIMGVALPCMLILLKKELQLDLFETLNKWLAFLLAISFVFWCIYLAGVSLPHSIITPDNGEATNVYTINNYYLFQVSNTMLLDGFMPEFLRFNGIFLEAGHLGTIVAIFLFANAYDFSKWYNKIFLFVVIVSFSAAAYVLSLIGYVLISSNKRNYMRFGISLIVLLGILVFFMNYDNGNNIINQVVIDKVLNSERGLDNRFNFDTDMYYDRLWATGDYFWGLGSDADLIQSSGYKVFIIRNGVFVAFLTVCAYYYIYLANKTRKVLFFLVLLLVSFIQRTYCFWDAILDPYILGASFLFYKDEMQSNNLDVNYNTAVI